jgi:dolichol-phosphate mannosyltransferase
MPSVAVDAPAATIDSDRLWVVLPVYNEAAAIARVIAEWTPVLAEADRQFVLLVVDDGSTDETPAILQRLARDEPRLRIVRQANRGHGAACRHGYEIATAPESDASFVLQIDSDGQCDPADLAAFWELRREHPRQLGRRSRRGDGWLRAATSRALAWLVSVAAGQRVRDPNVPFRLLRRDVLADALERLGTVNGVEVDRVELVNSALAVVCVEKGPVRWVDIAFRQRYAGRSHYRAARMAGLALGLVRWLVTRRWSMGREQWRSQHPAWTRVAAAVAWGVLAAAVAVYAARNLGSEEIWYDEAMQVHTSLGVHPMAEPFSPQGSLREVVWRNAADQLDPGGFGVLLHVWMRVFGTEALVLRALSGLLMLAGLAALAVLAGRWIRHPLAPPAAVALALADNLVREHALEIRPYALEMAGVWVAFLAADRLVARPGVARSLTLGLVLVALLGSRYSAFLTSAALAGAVVFHLWPLRARDRDRRHPWLILATLLPPALGLAAIARWSVPGLLRRASWNDGELVGYLDAYKAGAQTLPEGLVAALGNLIHPAALSLTVMAMLAMWRVRATASRNPSPRSHLVGRAAILLLLVTIVLWPWHPWAPGTKWSFYLRLVSSVCLLRLVADAFPWLLSRVVARRAAASLAVGVVALGAWLVARHERWRWDVAFPALVRVGDSLVGEGVGVIAVDPYPMPLVRYHYEFGSLRGRPEYPRAFVLPHGGSPISPEAMCSARWLLSFESIARLQERHPALRFEEDPVADQLLRVVPRESPATPCGSPSPVPPIERGSSGGAR